MEVLIMDPYTIPGRIALIAALLSILVICHHFNS